MGILIKTHKMLWGRAANRCAFPECRLEQVMDASETDDESLVGEECHIVARERNGPRGNTPLASNSRDMYDNLILLCNVHHKLIDDQVNTYTVQVLKEMKASHEKWVRKSLEGFDSARQHDEELYAVLIEGWMRYADIENWKAWTSHALSDGQPKLLVSDEERLKNLSKWIFSRIWPERYPELEAAFENFLLVLQDFLSVFHKHTEKHGDWYTTVKFYQVRGKERDLYHELGEAYDFHVDLVEDLMLELTRAANYLCERIRQFIDPTFRLKEGVILVESGPTSSLSFELLRTRYHGNERTLRPYPGLERFKIIRKDRDVHFGTGVEVGKSY
jgi:hypothetical protein